MTIILVVMFPVSEPKKKGGYGAKLVVIAWPLPDHMSLWITVNVGIVAIVHTCPARATIIVDCKPGEQVSILTH